jgi:urease accessory protein
MFRDIAFLLQTSDPLFPTGAYAHSFGLEEFVRLSGTGDEAGVRDFMTHQVLPALAGLELPYFRFAHECAGAGDLAGLVELDREVNAWKVPEELRVASLGIGGRRLDILLKVAPTALLAAVSAAITAGEMPGHHLTISAAQYAGVSLDEGLAAYAYQSLASYCVAALKLVRIGQEACQRILTHCLGLCEGIVGVSKGVLRSEAGCFSPLLEIASMRHQFAGERLFIS